MTNRRVVSLSLLAGLTACPAAAEVLEVPTDHPSIQTAIDAADDGDEIVVLPGTYPERINMLGKAITLRSQDGPESTIIDAEDLGRVVRCLGGEGPDTVIEGFTLTRGYSAANGGGVMCDGTSPTLIRCNITLCEAALSGGGLMVRNGGHPTLIDTNVSGRAATFGAGVFVFESGVTIRARTLGSVVTGFATTASGGGGGLAVAHGTAELVGVRFDDAYADADGGAIFAVDSDVSLSRCEIIDCGAWHGGGLSTEGGTLTVDASRFRNNTGWFGGGGAMHLDGTTSLITNTSITGCIGLGAAVACVNGNPQLINCTLVENAYAHCCATPPLVSAHALYGEAGVVFTLTNCIVWGNRGGFLGGAGQADVTWSCVQGGHSGIGNINRDPGLAVGAEPPHLLAGSPCIDAGDSSALPAKSVDGLGQPRFVDDAGSSNTGVADGTAPIDMGAGEFQETSPPRCLTNDRQACERLRWYRGDAAAQSYWHPSDAHGSSFIATPGNFPPETLAVVVTWTGARWVEVDLPSDVVAEPMSVTAAALGEGIAVVGLEDLSGFGSAIVYELNGEAWEVSATLTPPEGVSPVSFGWPVAVDGDRLVVGAAGIPHEPGAVVVYDRTGDTWIGTVLRSDDPAPNDGFGYGLAIAGDRMVVAEFDLENGGAVHLFERVTDAWVGSELPVPAGVEVGITVATDGQTAVFSTLDSERDGLLIYDLDTPAAAPSMMPFAGPAFDLLDGSLVVAIPDDPIRSLGVHRHDGDGWVRTDTVTHPDGLTGGTGFGSQVLLFDPGLVAGAPGDFGSAQDSGTVSVFDLEAGDCDFDGLCNVADCVDPCPADIVCDGLVDVNELVAIIEGWGTPSGDVDGDGITDVNDIVMVTVEWGPCVDG